MATILGIGIIVLVVLIITVRITVTLTTRFGTDTVQGTIQHFTIHTMVAHIITVEIVNTNHHILETTRVRAVHLQQQQDV